MIDVSPPQADGAYCLDWTMVFTALTEVVLDRTPLPSEPGGKVWGGYAGLSARLSTELTDEQRMTLRTTVLDLWLAGASREEICQEVEDLLGDFGIELPEAPDAARPADAAGSVPIRAQNFPNPANPETQINYTLGVSDDVRIQIYNISGQLVRTYDIGYQRQGSYSVRWDGRHQNGQPVASGVYFYRIQAGEHALTNRIVLLK